MKNCLMLLFLAAIFSGIPGNCNAQGTPRQVQIDSMLAGIPGAGEDSNKIKLLNAVSYIYRDVDPAEGIRYGEQSLALAEKIRWQKGIAVAYHNIGLNYDHQSNYPKALEYYLKSLNLDQKTGNRQGVADNAQNIGNIYSDQANYPAALEYHLKSLVINEALVNKPRIAINMLNIGNVYYGESNLPKALQYYLNCLEIAERTDQNIVITRVNGNIGSIYNDLGDYRSALIYYVKSLKKGEEMGDKQSIADNYDNIAIVYSRQKKYTQALEYQQKALKINEELGNKAGIAFNTGRIGLSYLNKAEDTTATAADKQTWLQRGIYNLEASTRQSLALGYLSEYENDIKILSEGYATNKQYDKALAALKEYGKYKDSIFNGANNRQLAHLEANYEYSKKEDSLKLENEKRELLFEKELQLNTLRYEYDKKQALAKTEEERRQLRYEEALKQRDIENQFNRKDARIARQEKETALEKGQKKLFLSLSVLASGVLLLLVFFYIRISRTNRLLEAKNLVIEHQRNELQSLNGVKDRLFSVISHDLRNPIATIKTYLSMAGRNGLTEEKKAAYLQQIGQSVTQTGDLLDNLLIWANLQLRRTAPAITPVSLADCITDVVSMVQSQAHQKQITITKDIGVTVANTNIAFLEIILRNLVTNAIKYSNAGASVEIITVITAAQKPSVIIKDHGIGMLPEQLEAIRTGETETTKGTAGERGSGMGLFLVQQLAGEINGCLIIDSIPGKGSIFTLELPLM